MTAAAHRIDAEYRGTPHTFPAPSCLACALAIADRERVEVVGEFPDDRVVWLRIDAPRDEARTIAEAFGRILESDVADDGRQSFAVVGESR